MRISKEEVNQLVESILDHRQNAKIYLFGSRADDQARGGDIDILVVSEPKLTFDEKWKVLNQFWNRFGEQKLDIMSFSAQDHDPMKSIGEEGILLNA